MEHQLRSSVIRGGTYSVGYNQGTPNTPIPKLAKNTKRSRELTVQTRKSIDLRLLVLLIDKRWDLLTSERLEDTVRREGRDTER